VLSYNVACWYFYNNSYFVASIEAALAKPSLEDNDDKSNAELEEEEEDIENELEGLEELGGEDWEEEEEEEEEEKEEEKDGAKMSKTLKPKKNTKQSLESSQGIVSDEQQTKLQLDKLTEVGNLNALKTRAQRNHVIESDNTLSLQSSKRRRRRRSCYRKTSYPKVSTKKRKHSRSRNSLKFVFADLIRRGRSDIGLQNNTSPLITNNKPYKNPQSDNKNTAVTMTTMMAQKHNVKKLRNMNTALDNRNQYALGFVRADKVKREEKSMGGSFTSFFKNVDIKSFIFSALKQAGLAFLHVYNISLGIHVKDKAFAVRVTGEAKPIFYFESSIDFEVIKNGVFGVGITADKAALGKLTETLFKKKINLFGKLRDPRVSNILTKYS
jgi:hypothetical protein